MPPVALESVASSSPILDLIILDQSRTALEHERGQHEDMMKEAAHVEARQNKIVSDLGARLRHHGSGMLVEDKNEIQANSAAASVALAEAQRGVKRHATAIKSLNHSIDEVKQASEAVYSALRKEVTAASTASSATSTSVAGKALRDGVFSIVGELSELIASPSTGATYVAYSPRVDEVPHFAAWEQRASAAIRALTDKFTAAHRAILSALNRISAGSPEIAACDSLWAMLVNDAATAFVAVAATVADAVLGEYRRIIEGGGAVALFALNVKLTANCKLVLAPATTDLTKLIMPLVDKVFEIIQLPPFRNGTSVQAKPLSAVGPRPVAAGKRSAVNAYKNGPFAFTLDDTGSAQMDVALRQIPCLADHVTAIGSAFAVLNIRVVDAVSDIESKHGHLWAPAVADLTLPQLEFARRALETDAGLANGTPVLGAIHLNTFPLHDTLLSMLAQHETKLRAASLAAQIEGFAMSMRDTSLKALRQVTLASLLPAGATASPLATKKAAVFGTSIPAAPVMKIAMPVNTAAADENVATTSKPAARTAPPPPVAVERMSADIDVATLELTPRPATTPVGTRNRAGAPTSTRNSGGSGSVQPTSVPKENNNPSTPNPKASSERGGAAAVTRPTGDAAAAPQPSPQSALAWDTPPRPQRALAAPVPEEPRSPASQARVASTMHMTTPPPQHGPTAVTRGPSDMERLAMKEKESMERLRQLRLQSERRALAQQSEAPTPEQVLAAQQQSPTTDRAPLAPLASGRGPATPRTSATASATDATIDDLEARRQSRATTLQTQRLLREREMLLEAHRAQEKRRADDKIKAEQELEARVKQEQVRRAEELARERDAEDRRREAADQDRKKREAQRRLDEEREAQLRQRLDELERRREADRKKFTEDQARRSNPASPQQAERPPSVSKLPVASSTVVAPPASASNSNNSALRKKLNLPPAYADGGEPAAVNSARSQATELPPVSSARGSAAVKPTTSAPAPTSVASTSASVAVAATPQPPPSVTPMAAHSQLTSPVDVPIIDVEGKSHLDVYRAYCTALAIKPNSGLLKTLPTEVGKHCSVINLDLNYIGVRGVRPLIEILRINRGLTLLNLKDNNLENAEVRQLVSVLMGEPGSSLAYLDLSNNPISLAGGSAIMDLVARQPTLKTVVLKGTLIQAKVVEKIVEAAARNPGGA